MLRPSRRCAVAWNVVVFSHTRNAATQVTGTVTAIDQEQRTATLQFKDGSTKTLPVRDDIDLTLRKVGDRVVFRLTEKLAISVEKP